LGILGSERVKLARETKTFSRKQEFKTVTGWLNTVPHFPRETVSTQDKSSFEILFGFKIAWVDYTYLTMHMSVYRESL